MKPNRSQQFVRGLAHCIYWMVRLAGWTLFVTLGAVLVAAICWSLHVAMRISLTVTAIMLIMVSYEWAKRKLGK